MKRIFILITLLFIICLSSNGQWYVKKYGVSDINYLTGAQLSESLKNANQLTLASWIVAGMGGLMIFFGRDIVHHGLPEDATFLEQLLGNKFMGNTYIVLGTGILAGGTVCGFAGLGRIASIKSAIKRNNAPLGLLTVSPEVFLNNDTRSVTPGVGVKINF